MKLPAFQFYPADWRKDPGIQALSRHDRSVWFDMLCLMHESDQRGVMLLAGVPVPEEALARMLNLDNQTCNQTVSTLLVYGVASKRQSDGAIYSRRMVRDEELIQIRRNAGKLGGNPVLLKQKQTTPVKQKGTPSSSSSSSSSDKSTPLPPKGDEEGGGNHILPKNWKQLTITERKQTRVNTNSKMMNRIGKFFGRRDGTLWSVAEAVALKTVSPTPEEVQIVETYYLDDTIEKDSDYRRKDLITLLNNWSGELDRARIFMTENGIKI